MDKKPTSLYDTMLSSLEKQLSNFQSTLESDGLSQKNLISIKLFSITNSLTNVAKMRPSAENLLRAKSMLEEMKTDFNIDTKKLDDYFFSLKRKANDAFDKAIISTSSNLEIIIENLEANKQRFNNCGSGGECEWLVEAITQTLKAIKEMDVTAWLGTEEFLKYLVDYPNFSENVEERNPINVAKIEEETKNTLKALESVIIL